MSASTSRVPPSSRSSRPASIAPSISSVLSDATTITAPVHEQRGFKSREAYLAALNDFAESKLYMPTGDHTLHGWYGTQTMDDYKNRPGLRDGRKKRRSSQAEGNDNVDKERRPTMAVVPEASDESASVPTVRSTEDAENDAPNAGSTEKQGRFRRLSRVFSGGSGSGSDKRATIS